MIEWAGIMSNVCWCGKPAFSSWYSEHTGRLESYCREHGSLLEMTELRPVITRERAANPPAAKPTRAELEAENQRLTERLTAAEAVINEGGQLYEIVADLLGWEADPEFTHRADPALRNFFYAKVAYKDEVARATSGGQS